MAPPSLQDIGEAEASELVALFQPLLARALPDGLLADVDLGHQEIRLQGCDLKQLVRAAGSMWGRQAT
jgi:hypothetical protein